MSWKLKKQTKQTFLNIITNDVFPVKMAEKQNVYMPTQTGIQSKCWSFTFKINNTVKQVRFKLF